MHNQTEKMEALGQLLEVLDTLRVKCPWDRKQTNESLRPNTIEETYELCDALMADDQANICKELGDVLLHVAFYAKIAEEKGQFDFADVCHKLTEKLKFRHPHIYGDVQAETAEQVKENWEALKLKEKGGNRTILAGVPAALPALIKAFRIQEKAADSGFDWEKREDVWNKVREEASEVHTEIERGNADRIEAEFGDLLFAVVNAARLYGVNPENALERTNRKFIHRFNHIEACAKARNRSLRDMTLAEMDVFWNEAKASESTPASDPEA